MPQERPNQFHLPKLTAATVLVMGLLPVLSVAQQPRQKTFSSPEDACNALVTATKNNDEKAMIEILGAEGRNLVSSGDDVEDSNNRANFVARYEEMHRLVREPDGSVVLYIGAKNWPTPIPVVAKGHQWYFDTQAAKREILYRRVGENEISAIRVCEELVGAEKEYYSSQNSVYASQIFSDPGQHNGLFWKAGDGEPQSPIGPLVAAAVVEGYKKGDNAPSTPYHGYYYNMLTSQGKNGPGGAKSYIVDGKMTSGFAFLAYPAEYRSSGVMTFIVGPDGKIYQKDLGARTSELAKSLKEFNPGAGWQKVDDSEITADAQDKQP